jgi:phenylpropionate dioxygenase-like ring-hydroxylating dioxygenase large terminal subunit
MATVRNLRTPRQRTRDQSSLQIQDVPPATNGGVIAGDATLVTRWNELVDEDRVHRTVYTDPKIFEEEMTKIFGALWIYLGHESEIPDRHDFRTRYLGRRPIILTRDSRGRVNGLLNRCRHRGATVCRRESGTAKMFTCPYHGWAYSNTGDLKGVPWPKGYGPEFERSAYGLARIRVEIYREFIFGTLNVDAPPLVDYLGPARTLLDEWIDRSPEGRVIVRSGALRMLARANWKLVMDNAHDGYHPFFSHRSLLHKAGRLGEKKDMQYWGQNPDLGPMYAKYLGNGHTFIDQRPNYGETGSYWNTQPPQPGREACEAAIRQKQGEQADATLDLAIGSQMNLNIYPSLAVIGNQIQVIEPIAVDRTQLTWYSTTIGGVPEEVNVLRMRTQEDFPHFGEVDDLANFEECQRGLAIPEVEWVLQNRGWGLPQQRRDGNGVVTAPVTDEMPARAQFAEWKRLMSSEPRLMSL